MSQMYTVQSVASKKDLKTFLGLPDRIYPGHKNYIQPLHLHTKMMLGPLGEKEKHILLAFEGDSPVARIAAKVHRQGGETLLHYGFFECIEGHCEAAKTLVDHLHSLHPELKMMGPYHFVMEDPYIGTLIKGFDQEPYVFMPYNPEYYDGYLRNAGLTKAMDLFTFECQVTSCPKQFTRIAERGRKQGTTARWLDPKNLKQEVKIIADIFNDSLANNWGFEPITEDQLDEMFLIFKYVIDPRTVCFTVKDGREIGCLIFLPNLNPLIKTASGKLSLPFLWRLFTQRKNYDQARGYALGMRQGHQGSGNVCLLIEMIYQRAIDLGLKTVEISWVLENNRQMTAMAESLGGVHNKTYRVYEKAPLS